MSDASKTIIAMVIVAQGVLNGFLGLWLYMEYLSNPFMQQYVNQAAGAYSLPIGLGLGLLFGGCLAWALRLRGKRPISDEFNREQSVPDEEDFRSPGYSREDSRGTILDQFDFPPVVDERFVYPPPVDEPEYGRGENDVAARPYEYGLGDDTGAYSESDRIVVSTYEPVDPRLLRQLRRFHDE